MVLRPSDASLQQLVVSRWRSHEGQKPTLPATAVRTGRMKRKSLAFLKHALQLLLGLQPGHLPHSSSPDFALACCCRHSVSSALREGVIKLTVAKFFFRTGQLRVGLVHLFFRQTSLCAAVGLWLRSSPLRLAGLCAHGAIAALLWRLSPLWTPVFASR